MRTRKPPLNIVKHVKRRYWSLADRLRVATPAEAYGLLAEGRGFSASSGTRRKWARIAAAVQERR